MCEILTDSNSKRISGYNELTYGQFLLERLRKIEGNRIALVNSESGERLSYKKLLEFSINLSVSLSNLGIGNEDTVALCSEKRNEFIPIAISIILTGAKYTPIYANCGKAVLLHKLYMTKPKTLICSGNFWKKNASTIKSLDFLETVISLDDASDGVIALSSLLRNTIDVDHFEPAGVKDPNDVPIVLYSSGTTGMPKGVLLHHEACILNSLESDFKESMEIIWISGDWYHNYDFFVSISNLCCGKTVVWHGTDDIVAETILKAVKDYKIDVIVTVPSIIIALAKAQLNLIEKYAKSLKVFYCSAAPLLPFFIDLCNIKYPNVTVYQSYGMTEVGPVTSETLSASKPKPGSIGIAFPGVILKVVNVDTKEVLGQGQVGELCVKSPAIMKGYVGKADQITDSDGFFSTGDLAYYDEDNYFFIVGRIKEIINYDGYKVSPHQIEIILMSHPKVRDAGVVGKPDEVNEEVPTAFVVLEPGAKVTENELEAFVAAEVCEYMKLRGGVLFVDEIPRNPMKKILRQVLREQLFVK